MQKLCQELTTVANCKGDMGKRDRFDVYIGRADRFKRWPESEWHNPYKQPRNATAAQRIACIEKYRVCIATRPDLLARLSELKGKRLGEQSAIIEETQDLG